MAKCGFKGNCTAKETAIKEVLSTFSNPWLTTKQRVPKVGVSRRPLKAVKDSRDPKARFIYPFRNLM